MSMVKVSVVVPVYNTEPFLCQCLESLSHQTIDSIEFILVDDGSTDCSGAICDEYAAKDSRFQVFHKENGGSASARQLGLEHIRGEFYTVCDSDDWVEPTMYAELYEKAKSTDADIVVCDFLYNYVNGTQKLISYRHQSFEQDQFLRNVISGKVAGSTCNKLFKTEIIRKYNISYEPGINQGEDALFLMKVLIHPIHIVYMPKAFYHYRRQFGKNTYTNHPTLASFRQIGFIHNWKVEHFSDPPYGRELFLSSINRAFTILRIADFPELEYKKLLRNELVFDKFLRYRLFSLKALLVICSKINIHLALFLFKISYRMLYR